MKVLLALVLAAMALPVTAQDYPTRPIHIVIPFPPGGATDTITRRIGERLTQKWGQAVIVENKPGANTVIGTEAVKRADADGYTVLMTSPAGLVRSCADGDTLIAASMNSSTMPPIRANFWK